MNLFRNLSVGARLWVGVAAIIVVGNVSFPVAVLAGIVG